MASRNGQEKADLEARIAALETALEALRRKVDRMEGGEVRILKATPFDGRARARPGKGGPRCPGCRLILEENAPRCPFCSLPFAVLPTRLRPVFPAKGGGKGRVAAPRPRRPATKNAGRNKRA